MSTEIQKKDVNQIFQMMCLAFPDGNIKIVNCNGVAVLNCQNLGNRCIQEENFQQRSLSETIYDGESVYRICIPLSEFYSLILYLPVMAYTSGAELAHMTDMLLEQIDMGRESYVAFQHEEEGDNHLLNSLLYADTMEMQIYAVLLAKEGGRNLDLPRVVVVIRSENGKQQELLQTILRFRRTHVQDIVGTIGEEDIVLCKYLLWEDRTVKSQCDEYFRELQQLTLERYGFEPRICCGTMTHNTSDYGYSLSVAFTISECTKNSRNRIAYLEDYLAEYIFFNTEHVLLEHFLEPYAKKLNQEPQLLQIAEALIECNMNMSRTAEMCYVHRNTMTFYAKRLWELLDIDPVHYDKDKLLLLLICLYYRKNYYK